MQTLILGLLAGTVRGRVFGGGSISGTPEIVAELIEFGLVNAERPRKQQTFTVRRALTGLHSRGYVEGVYRKGLGVDMEPMPSWGYYIEWTITDAGREYLATGQGGQIGPNRS